MSIIKQINNGILFSAKERKYAEKVSVNKTITILINDKIIPGLEK